MVRLVRRTVLRMRLRKHLPFRVVPGELRLVALLLRARRILLHVAIQRLLHDERRLVLPYLVQPKLPAAGVVSVRSRLLLLYGCAVPGRVLREFEAMLTTAAVIALAGYAAFASWWSP